MSGSDDLVATWQKMLGGFSELAAGAELRASECEAAVQVLVDVAQGMLSVLPALVEPQASQVAALAERTATTASALRILVFHWRLHRDAFAGLSSWKCPVDR